MTVLLVARGIEDFGSCFRVVLRGFSGDFQQEGGRFPLSSAWLWPICTKVGQNFGSLWRGCSSSRREWSLGSEGNSSF